MGRDGKPVPYNAVLIDVPNSNLSAPKKGLGRESFRTKTLCTSFRPQPKTFLHANEAGNDNVQNHQAVSDFAKLLFLL